MHSNDLTLNELTFIFKLFFSVGYFVNVKLCQTIDVETRL